MIADFEYNIDRHGNPYGWGVARYTTPEALYGPLNVDRTPGRIVRMLARPFPTSVPRHGGEPAAEIHRLSRRKNSYKKRRGNPPFFNRQFRPL